MFVKPFKALVLLQLVVLATLAPIVHSQILKRDFGGASFGRGMPLPTIYEDVPLKDGSQPSRLQRQLALVRGYQHTKPIMNRVNIGDRFLAVKLPQNSWDRAVIERMKGYNKPFFVQGQNGAVEYYFTKDGRLFTKQRISEADKAAVRDIIGARGGTVITPSFKYVRPAVTGAGSEAASGGSWISRLASRWYGGFTKGLKYLRGP